MISQTRFSDEQLTWTPDMFVSKSHATHLENAGFNQSKVKKTLLYEHVRTFEEKTRTHTKQTNNMTWVTCPLGLRSLQKLWNFPGRVLVSFTTMVY